MFSIFSKGPKAPSQLPPYNAYQSTGGQSFAECKLDAWALATGARVPLEHPYQGRRRRGGLSDIDLSGASPDPGYRSPLRRLANWLGQFTRRSEPLQAPVTTVSGAVCERIGKPAGISYIGEAGSAQRGDAGEAEENANEDAGEHALKRAA